MKFPSAHAPYAIVTPPWNRCSAGVRALHYLCHALNEAGEKAYLVFKVGDSLVNPNLNTPVMSQEVLEFYIREGIEPIVVYPDIVQGNPCNAKRVVRYLLYFAGAFGGDKEFPETDMVYSYSTVIRDHFGRGGVLPLPVSDPAVFYDKKYENRSGELFYSNKHRLMGGELLDVSKNAKEITKEWPRNHAELAEVFNRAEVLYVYEDTSLTLEAILCGCKVVGLYDGAPFPEFCSTEMYRTTIANFPAHLQQFITRTQWPEC